MHVPAIRSGRKINPDRLAEVKGETDPAFATTDWEELLKKDELEAIIISATPESTHYPMIKAALEAGKHVFVEKPFTLNTADGRAAVEAAEEAGIVLMVGHQRRRQAANRHIKAMIDDGTIGTPVHGESSFFISRGYPDSWRANPDETPLGGMTALGVHCLDTYHYLLGEVARVSAFSNSIIDGQPLDHATGLLLEMTSGAVATLPTTHFAPAASRVAIFGSEGAGFNEDDGKALFIQGRDEPTRKQIDFEYNDIIAEQIDEFAAAIRGTGTVETGGAQGLAVIAVLEAAVASVARGSVVEVSEFA